MDDSTKRLLQRLIRRIPTRMLRTTLDKWGRLTAAQQKAIDLTQPKWTFVEKLLDICEVRGAFSERQIVVFNIQYKNYSKLTARALSKRNPLL